MTTSSRIGLLLISEEYQHLGICMPRALFTSILMFDTCNAKGLSRPENQQQSKDQDFVFKAWKFFPFMKLTTVHPKIAMNRFYPEKQTDLREISGPYQQYRTWGPGLCSN